MEPFTVTTTGLISDIMRIGKVKMNNPKDVNSMYIKNDSLSTRVNLHEKYSVNKYGWKNWVFDQYTMRENISILEFGCGTGISWTGKDEQIPENVHILLTDISPLMIEKAKANLGSNKNFSFQVMDIQNMQSMDKRYDIIIANHLLYHVPDIEKALSEIDGILKDDGIFYSTTIGFEHLKELENIYKLFEGKVKFSYSGNLTFTLDNGKEILSNYFRTIDLKRYEDSLEITNVNDLMDYILSYNDVPKGVCAEITNYLERLILEKKVIKIKKDSGMFICRK